MTSYRIGHAPRLPRRPLRFRLLHAACVVASFASAFLAGSWAWVHTGAAGGVLVAFGIAWLALKGRTPEVPVWRDADLKQASPSVPSGTVLAAHARPWSGDLTQSPPG